MSPLRPFEPKGHIAGKYRLRRRLAIGGMGEVWVACNEDTGADVALKVLRREIAQSSAQAAERFRHEARVSAKLSHRNIIKIFDLLTEPDGTLVLVMEFLRGETLQAYLERRGPRSSREAVAILLPILSALQHAHDAGLVHRDVTPANIFLAVDPDGLVTPKLVDFGIAKAPDAPVKTLEDRVLGTPRYMSPEQIRAGVDVDARSDLFGVGVVLYETLTGVSPFAANTPAASLAAVIERRVDPDPRIDPRLWFEIQRALAKQPYERHRSASEMAEALCEAIGEGPESLASALKRQDLPPRVSTDTAIPRPHQTRSFDGQSISAPPRIAAIGTRFSWAVGMALGIVLGVLGVIGVVSMRDRADRSNASGAASFVVSRPPEPEKVEALPPTPSAAPPPATSDAGGALTPDVSVRASASPSPPPPPPPKRPAPKAPVNGDVALTPGF